MSINKILEESIGVEKEVPKGVDELGRAKLWQEIVEIAEIRGGNKALADLRAKIPEITDKILEEWNKLEKLDHHCKCENKHFVSIEREKYDRFINSLKQE